VRCIRNRARCECLAEADTIPGECIESRSADAVISITVNMVSAESVYCD